jgi:hypothetical protein
MMSLTPRSVLRLLPLLAMCVACGEGQVVRRDTPIRINEVNPQNAVYQDLLGDTEDWFELYNPSDTDFDLAGYFVSDSDDKRFAYDSVNERYIDELPEGCVVPAGGVLLIYADSEPDETTIYPKLGIVSVHVNFNLSSEGEGVWLSDPDGYVIDSIDFTKVPPNDAGTEWTSFARFPDGTGPFRWCTESSPEELNGKKCRGEVL